MSHADSPKGDARRGACILAIGLGFEIVSYTSFCRWGKRSSLTLLSHKKAAAW